MAKYMKGRFQFLGLKKPAVATATKHIVKSFGEETGSWEDMEAAVMDLWDQPEREFQYIAQDMVGTCFVALLFVASCKPVLCCLVLPG